VGIFAFDSSNTSMGTIMSTGYTVNINYILLIDYAQLCKNYMVIYSRYIWIVFVCYFYFFVFKIKNLNNRRITVGIIIYDNIPGTLNRLYS